MNGVVVTTSLSVPQDGHSTTEPTSKEDGVIVRGVSHSGQAMVVELFGIEFI